MSAQARPISPTRFASALKDLGLASLYGKVSEFRNQLAHLDYSNEEMQAFADGTAPGLTEPDKDCITAIEENEVVIKRIVERLALLRAEIEGRGNAWLDGEKQEELRLANGHLSDEERRTTGDEPIVVNEDAPNGRSAAWTDGTFTTGRIVNGEIVMDREAGNSAAGREEVVNENQQQREPRTQDSNDEGEGIHL